MNKITKILIVDDETIVAMDLKATLNHLGYTVCGMVPSGEDALVEITKQHPNLVLMDIVLQGELSGIETAQIVKDRFDIPVVYLTSHTDEATLDQAKVTGPYGYLVKPFESKELKTTIELALYKHHTEKELRESEAWFSTTFRSIGDGVIVTDNQGMITFLNPYSVMLTGYAMDEAMGKPLDDVFIIQNERDSQRITGLVQHALATGESTEIIDTAVLVSRDGREVPVDISSSPVKGGGSSVTGVVLVFHDTLDRKLTEEALRESEERYRSIFEESRDAIYIVTRNGHFVIANQSFMDLFGYTREEVIQRHITDLFLDKAEWRQFQTDVEAKGAVRDYAVTMQDQHGAKLECLLTASIRISPDSKILGYQGIIRDMTEKNRAERASRESEQRYRLLAENVMDVIWILNTDLRFTYVTPSVTPLLGYPVDEFLGLHLQRLCDAEIFQEVLSQFGPVLSSEHAALDKNGADRTLEIPLRHKSGERIWIDVSFTDLLDDDNVKIGILGVVHDISRRKAAEVDKERIHAQLLQAQKMEAVGLLAGGVAHDFNNLLTVIQGNTDLAMMSLNKEDMLYADLQEIHKASQRAAELTSQLLLFSRKQPMRLVSININRVVEDLLKMLHRLIGEDVGVHTELASDLELIQADRGSLEQVVMNLAVNARDAMPNGGEFIIRTQNVVLDNEAVRAMTEGRPGRFVVLSLSDTGVGMEESTLERIFEPFFSTKGRGQGTGLGLSVVYGIVKQHQGWIDVKSRVGAGSAFHIYFPVQTGSRAMASDAPDEVADHRGQGEFILVIEDESGVRHLTTKALTEHGYRVISAKNAAEARSLFTQERFRLDMVVSDVVLPDGTGVELVGEFRAVEPELPVLLCSGYTDQKSQWETIQEKGYPFLQKPFNISDLLRKVQHFVHKANGAGK